MKFSHYFAVGFFFVLSLTAQYSSWADDLLRNRTASLLTYLDEQIALTQEYPSDNGDADCIAFSDADVGDLWEGLLQNANSSVTLNSVQNAFDQCSEAKTLLNNRHYPAAFQAFNSAYQTLYLLWIEQCDDSSANFKASMLSSRKVKDGESYNDFDTNPYISKEEHSRIHPFLLPISHPLKSNLDAIFLSTRVTLNRTTFNDAGFTIRFSQSRSFIIVASHHLLPNHLVKVYLDSELRNKKNVPGWLWFVRRCEGAKKIRKVIKKNEFKYFSAPLKWLYPLPVEPAPPQDPFYTRHNFVLLVQDMQLTDSETNLRAWKTLITKAHLQELYVIISYANGSSYRADNIPYTKEGNFAFIDTEYPYRSPNFKNIRRYLSDEMRQYWDHLIRKGGP